MSISFTVSPPQKNNKTPPASVVGDFIGPAHRWMTGLGMLTVPGPDAAEGFSLG